MRKYVLYYRASTQEQEESGLGLQAQARDAERVSKDGTVVGTFVEIESGRKSNRPTLAKAIELAKKEEAILIIAKLDRLTRDSLFLNQLLASELKFICCDNPEATPMVLRILAAVAEDEVDKIRKRTKDGLASIKKNIELNGYHISKNGNKITSLGNQMKFSSEEEKSEHYRNIANQREYKLASEIGADLARALKQNGMKVPQIKEQLEKNSIIVSRRTIYNYIK
jgi:DNA invertase Pin-like site-specific DNA recombinase